MLSYPTGLTITKEMLKDPRLESSAEKRGYTHDQPSKVKKHRKDAEKIDPV